MLCRYHCSFSCLLLLLEFATQCLALVCQAGQFNLGSTDCYNCPRGKTQSLLPQCVDTRCCVECQKSTYQNYFEPEGRNLNVGCRRCPTRHETTSVVEASNRDEVEDCYPCPYDHSYMMQYNDLLPDAGAVSLECRECPEHSSQGELNTQIPPWPGNNYIGDRKSVV